MNLRRRIKTDGKIELFDKPLSLTDIRILLGCEMLDTVRLKTGMVMLVDDAGHEHKLPVNPIATQIYLNKCIPGTDHKIRGDVFVVPDSDFGGIH